MTRGITALMACSALLLAGGCGESSEPPKHPTPAAEPRTASTTKSSGEYIPGPTVPAPLPPGGVAISIKNIHFTPEDVTVRVGSTVSWTNRDSVEHNVTSVSGPVSFKSRNISDGNSFQLKFTRPGVYSYMCTIHGARMHGTITVVH